MPNIEFRDGADSVELESLLRDRYGTHDHDERGVDIVASSSALPAGKTRTRAIDTKPAMQKQTPIPYLQVFFVAMWRTSQSLYFLVIMPFINFMMVEDLHLSDEAGIGKYSGMVEASAALGMCSGVFIFAHISDRYGRKWVTLIGVGAASILCALFGFGRTFGQLLFLRFAMGFANSAQSATAKVMISEMTDSSNEAISMAFMGTGWQMGAVCAPMIGASMSHPARWAPGLFAGTIFEKFPYALPCVVVAIPPAIAVIFAIFLADETHPGVRAGSSRTQYSKLGQSLELDRKSPSSLSEREPGLFSCGAGFILLLRFLILIQALWNGSCELLLFFSSKAIGGLGLTQTQMSLFLAVRPLLTAGFTLVVCPWLFRKYNTVQILRGAIFLPPVYTSSYLLLAYAAGRGAATGALTVFLLSIVLVVQTLSNPLFLSSNVILNARAPTQEQLSRLNAWCELVNQIGIGLGAEVGSVLYAFSNENQILPGKLPWLGLTIFGVMLALTAQKTTQIPGWRERNAAELEKE